MTAVQARPGPPRRSPVAWLLAPAPARRLAMLRILVGGYATVWAVARLPAHLDHIDQPATRWQPVGVLAPLDAPLPGAAVAFCALAAPVLAAAFTAGWRYRVIAPATAAVVLVLATLDSAWVQVFHTENLMVLHLLILAAAPAAADALVLRRRGVEPLAGVTAGEGTSDGDGLLSGAAPRPADGALSGGAPRPGEGGTPPDDDPRGDRYGWPVRLAAVVVVLTYVIAGIAKLRTGGIAWLDGDTLRHLVAYDNLRKDLLGDVHSPLGTWLVAYPWVFPPLAIATVAIELGSPVALLGGRWRTAWVIGAWLFHVGVLALMAVVFPYPLSGVAFAPFFHLERLRVERLVPPRLRAPGRPLGRPASRPQAQGLPHRGPVALNRL
jgi:hypothetical protein